MNTTGSLILLLALGLVVVVGIGAMGDLLGEASTTNDTAIQTAATGGESVTAPLFTVLGWLVVLLGGMIAIKAFI